METSPDNAVLEEVRALLAKIAGPAPKASLSIDEAAAELGRAAYTVREWCRLGQVNATKHAGWRCGRHDQWRISGAEVARYRAEGLLPQDRTRNAGR
jgi:hypothetical protein